MSESQYDRVDQALRPVGVGIVSRDFISLTDIAKYKTSENPGFHYLEFEAIERDAGFNHHKRSRKNPKTSYARIGNF